MIIDFLPCLPDMQDEVLVTKDHPVVLSVAAPKEVRKMDDIGIYQEN